MRIPLPPNKSRWILSFQNCTMRLRRSARVPEFCSSILPSKLSLSKGKRGALCQKLLKAKLQGGSLSKESCSLVHFPFFPEQISANSKVFEPQELYPKSSSDNLLIPVIGTLRTCHAYAPCCSECGRCGRHANSEASSAHRLGYHLAVLHLEASDVFRAGFCSCCHCAYLFFVKY